MKYPWCVLFCSLIKTFNLFFHKKSPLVIFITFLGTCSSTSFLSKVGSSRRGRSIWDEASQGQSREGKSPPTPCYSLLFWCSPGYHWPYKLQGHAAGWCPAFHSLGPTRLHPQGWPQLALLPVCAHIWGCPDPSGVPCTWPSLTSSHFSSLSKSLWMASLSSILSTVPFTLVLSENLVNIHPLCHW